MRAQQSPAPAPTLPSGEKPPPEITPPPQPSATMSPKNFPSPSVSPAASATPANARDSAQRQSFRSNESQPRAAIDALPPDDVQEALQLLKNNYVRPDTLSDNDLARATLQGVIERLGTSAALISANSQNAKPSPFYSEIFNETTGYLRLGALTKNTIGELDEALKNFKEKPVKSIVLDLRATTDGSEFETAADVLKRFCAKGKVLFSLKKSGEKPERIFTSNTDPIFSGGLLVVLVDESTSGAAEVIAAVLRAQASALVVGEKTSAHAFEFSDMPLHGSGVVLRVAVAEVALPDKDGKTGSAVLREGLQPDIAIAMPPETKREVMQLSREKGIAAVVNETERQRLNEAALVAGRNPEIDELEAAQRNRSAEKTKSQLIDTQLQRALDLITTVSIFENKRGQK